MIEIFADGIRAVALANGVVRIELVQLKRGPASEGQSQLSPEPVATLLLPARGLEELTRQLAGTVKKIRDNAQAGPAPSQGQAGEIDEALTNL